MEFRILGPLEVEVGGQLLPLRGRRQRALLALLLLSANEVVPDDRLLEDLWGDEPPTSGRAALRVRVSQLRKALGEAGDALLTRPPGYVLHVEPDRIDARLFERLYGEGRRQLADGSAELAAMTLREALGLWRGPALADVAYETFVQSEIARLEELRRAALEERIDADLVLGRHVELVGELDALVVSEPLRERLRGQLMLALYRSGRQADALAAYRDARQALVEELGIEPGRSLAELESAILRQDPALEAPEPAVIVVETQPAPPEPAEERKLVTVVVADLAGPTPLGATDDPERAGLLLERFRAAMEAELDEAGGRLEAIAGDALTAVFGAPVAQEDHAERALHAALSMRHRLDELFGGALVLRIGIESGEVVVGRSPDGGSTLAGSALTTAARLAQSSEPGSILVGERAASSAGSAFEFGAALEAGEAGIRARPLVRELALIRTEGTGGLHASFVGREGELDLLRSLYRRTVEEARPRLVTVTGDAGVGKSRLTRELWDWLARQEPEPLRRTGRCLPYGRGTTYRPLADVLREQLDLRETDAGETVRRRLAGREILGLTLGLDVTPELHPLAARDELQSAWVALLSELAAEHALVMLVEDLHWAQEPLLDLLERLLDDVDGSFLVVGTARPELAARHPAWGRRRDAATIWLEPLSLDDSELLLDTLLEDDAPPELRRAALERAEGNPFFLEELLAGVHDHSLPLETDVPDSVQAVLAARIDLLPPIDKAALQAASVIGRVFWRGPVRELLEGESPDFAVLEGRDFIRRRSGSSLAGEREFAFKHALTREVAYASLPKARRARLHAGFADWLDRVAEGRDEQAAFLAHHYAEAVRPEDADLAWAGHEKELERLRARAVTWLRRAAELAISRYELDEAIALYERALELAPPVELRVELWRALGRANALKYDGEGLWNAMQNAIELCSDRETEAELYSELAHETATRSGMWRRMPDYPMVDEWIETALRLAPPDSRARTRALIAKGFWNPFNGSGYAREASILAERLGDVELRSHAMDVRGIAEFVAGRYELGRAFAERRFEFLDQISDPDHRADIYAAPISGCVWSGQFSEARRLADLHDETTAPLTPHHRLHGSAILVEVEELLGAWDRIRALTPRTEEAVADNAATPCVRNARTLLVCAVAGARLGDEASANRLEQSAEDLGIEGYGVVLDVPRMQLALARGDLDAVARLLETPLPERGWYRGWMALATIITRLDGLAAVRDESGVEQEAAPHLRPNTYLEPFALRALGIVREDPKLLTQALAGFEALGLDWHAGQTRALV
jgi:DNA-binding SARP family transcriptional activator